MFEEILGMAAGGSASGEINVALLGELRKALQSTSNGYSAATDVNGLSGGAALRLQSLESTMLATIQENDQFKLFNALQSSKAIATVDEWTEQHGVGGFLGGSTNGETDAIQDSTGDYIRQVGMVKFLMTKRQVSLVTATQGSLADAEAVEYNNGALQLLTDAEFLAFEGDSSVVPTEFDGLDKQLANYQNGANVFDAAGAAVKDITWINKAVQQIVGYGNWGKTTDIFLSPTAQADFDNHLDPAWRVSLGANSGPLAIGSPVDAIRTSWGRIKMNWDAFVRDEPQQMLPRLMYSGTYLNDTIKPVSAAVAVNASGGATSNFTAANAGNYYYAVVGINNKGFSSEVVSAQAAVAAGGSVTLTITASAGGQETGYAIFRCTKGGTVAPSGFRLMCRVPKNVSGTTGYTDINRDVPGSTSIYLLNLTPGSKALDWRQFLPMSKFNLAAVNSAVIPWAQLLMGYLRIGKRAHHAVIKNVVPDGAVWKPW